MTVPAATEPAEPANESAAYLSGELTSASSAWASVLPYAVTGMTGTRRMTSGTAYRGSWAVRRSRMASGSAAAESSAVKNSASFS
jgi:hypothetical protein